jgi:hypothetical protein
VTPQEQNEIRGVHERIDDVVDNLGSIKGSINGVALGVENISVQLQEMHNEIHGKGKNPGLRGRMATIEAKERQRDKRARAIKATVWSAVGGIGTVVAGWLASLFGGGK